jgi:hypothetical protein
MLADYVMHSLAVPSRRQPSRKAGLARAAPELAAARTDSWDDCRLASADERDPSTRSREPGAAAAAAAVRVSESQSGGESDDLDREWVRVSEHR